MLEDLYNPDKSVYLFRPHSLRNAKMILFDLTLILVYIIASTHNSKCAS